LISRRGRSYNGGGDYDNDDGGDDNKNNNNKVLYYLCVGTTTTSPVTETAHKHNGISQIQATIGVIGWSLSARHAASSGF
jgi:hypothetical protein